MRLTCWRSPKVIRKEGGLEGLGLFATDFINAGELIAIKTGHIVDEEFIRSHPEIIRGSHLQITDDLFYAPTTEIEHSDTLIGFNHSCEPNAYFEGQIVLRTMRDIEPNEEITLDYVTYSTPDTIEFDCLCNAPSCRKHILPSVDWKNPDLQAKYKGYFTDYVQDKINQQANR